jgi:hypothetical protein
MKQVATAVARHAKFRKNSQINTGTFQPGKNLCYILGIGNRVGQRYARHHGCHPEKSVIHIQSIQLIP